MVLLGQLGLWVFLSGMWETARGKVIILCVSPSFAVYSYCRFCFLHGCVNQLSELYACVPSQRGLKVGALLEDNLLLARRKHWFFVSVKNIFDVWWAITQVNVVIFEFYLGTLELDTSGAWDVKILSTSEPNLLGKVAAFLNQMVKSSHSGWGLGG